MFRRRNTNVAEKPRAHRRAWVEMTDNLSSQKPRLPGWLRRRPELPVLVALLALCGLTWGFVKLAGLVHAGATQAFDERIVSLWRNPENHRLPLGPAWLVEAGAMFRPWAA